MDLRHLIQEALEKGYDVQVNVRRRDDGKEGLLVIPTAWAQKLGKEAEKK